MGYLKVTECLDTICWNSFFTTCIFWVEISCCIKNRLLIDNDVVCNVIIQTGREKKTRTRTVIENEWFMERTCNQMGSRISELRLP